MNRLTCCACGEAVEVGDFGKARGRRLFEQAVEAGERGIRGRFRSAGPGGVVIATASSPSTARISSRQSVKVWATPWPDRLEVATSSKRGLAGDRRHMLIGGDLAEAEDRDPDRLHRAADPAT